MSEKEKVTIRLGSETKERLERCYSMDGSKSQREFVERALNFYMDYMEMNSGNSLLPKEIIAALDGWLGMTEDRMASLLYKLAVAMDMNVGILADAIQMSAEDLRRRRAESVQNVKQTNGLISLEQRARDAGDEAW